MMFLDSVKMDGIYKCGSIDLDIPGTIPYMVHTIVVIVKIVVPILLIVFGMLDLGKAVVAAKEDEIKKGQQTFIKRAITAVIVFFVVQIVQLLVGFLSDRDKDITRCFNCFINGTVDVEKGCDSVN